MVKIRKLPQDGRVTWYVLSKKAHGDECHASIEGVAEAAAYQSVHGHAVIVDASLFDDNNVSAYVGLAANEEKIFQKFFEERVREFANR